MGLSLRHAITEVCQLANEEAGRSADGLSSVYVSPSVWLVRHSVREYTLTLESAGY